MAVVALLFMSSPYTQSGVTFTGACFEERPTALRAVKEPPASAHLPFCESLENKKTPELQWQLDPA